MISSFGGALDRLISQFKLTSGASPDVNTHALVIRPFSLRCWSDQADGALRLWRGTMEMRVLWAMRFVGEVGVAFVRMCIACSGWYAVWFLSKRCECVMIARSKVVGLGYQLPVHDPSRLPLHAASKKSPTPKNARAQPHQK
jgi:hypothetical protein